MHSLSLEFLTLFGIAPPELISIAAANSCQHVSIVANAADIDPAYEPFSVVLDPRLRLETAHRLRDTGISASLGEGLLIKPDVPVANYGPSLDAFAELGIPRINTICFDPQLNRGLESIAHLCDLALPYRIDVMLEFTPLSSVASLTDAVAALAIVRRLNLKIMIDSLHLARSGGTPADVAAIDQSLIGYAQVSDGRTAYPGGEEYYYEAVYERMLPGFGELPLVAFIKTIPPSIVMGAEVRRHSQEKAGIPPLERARGVINAVRKLYTVIN